MADPVIFDLDGLPADTERLHLAAYQETLAAHGVALVGRRSRFLAGHPRGRLAGAGDGRPY